MEPITLKILDYHVDLLYHDRNRIASRIRTIEEPNDEFIKGIFTSRVTLDLLNQWKKCKPETVESMESNDFIRPVNGMLITIYERYAEEQDRYGKNTYDKVVRKQYFSHEDVVERMPHIRLPFILEN